jgi:AcrR family transcriptional regulator
MSDEQFAAMQDRILDAAFELLHETGPGSLSIRAIAERAGVSHMGVYTYFDNRDALLAAVRDRQRRRLEARQEELLEQARAGDVCDAIRQALMIHVNFAREHPRAYRLFMVEPITSATQLHHHEARTHEQLRYLQALIEIGIKRGELAVQDSFLAAATTVSMINGPLILHHNGRMSDPDLRDRVVEEMLSIALAYLRTGVLHANPEP